MTLAPPAVPATRVAAVVGLLREVTDQKRVRAAHLPGSMADRAFTRAWAALVAGADPGDVAARETAAAVAGARLAGLDDEVLRRVGLDAATADAVRRRAVDEIAGGLHPDTVARLRAAGPPLEAGAVDAALPAFVAALAHQPRAGATAPGRARILVEPPENHAEHCWATAVVGALIADDTGADPGEAFLLGLAHHLHNAVLPDAGFAGEILLGDHLDGVVTRLTEAELATLPPALADRVRGLLDARSDADTPLGAAFHAADVLDRVLQVHHHARAAAFTARDALVDLELVHDSPVAAYQHAVVTAAGLDP